MAASPSPANLFEAAERVVQAGEIHSKASPRAMRGNPAPRPLERTSQANPAALRNLAADNQRGSQL
jgi:hypothetical protein